jgi:inosine-uridine nucleoside N-ribohydrolase
LNGKALIEKKAARWICMGGMFPEGKEANFYRPDPLSTVYCLQNWNKEVTFCGWEVGNKIITGGGYLKNKLTPKSPVYSAYELYNGFAGRPSWDQVAVLLLTDEWKRYFDVIDKGYCHVNVDGSNVWKTDKDSNQAYIILKPGTDYRQIAQYIDDMAVK